MSTLSDQMHLQRPTSCHVARPGAQRHAPHFSMGIGRYSRYVFHRVIFQTCAGIRLREVLEIYYSCRCHSLPRDLAGSSEALQSEDKSADRQDTWDEVICTQSDDDDNKRNGTLADILEDFDWRAELKLLEQENKQAEAVEFAPSGPEQFEDIGSNDKWQEKAFLVGVTSAAEQKASGYSLKDSLNELERLANSAGLQVVGRMQQQMDISSKTYLGSGKLQDLQQHLQGLDVETVIFDDELTPGQARALEKVLPNVSLCDRTALILDIFSQRAASREGKLQVELAQCQYQLPRLTRLWTHLERQAGGRVKGMGEKQIEIDKRLLRSRMAALRRNLDDTRRHRRQSREKRAEASIPVLALCGYTNAGKSTLLNRVADSDVMVRDVLFATLDPTTRRVDLPSGREVLFTDTVGFIQKLPTQLVAAFRATLEEIAEAQLLIHVVDVSHPNAAAQSAAVMKVLEELNASELPLITVWNKVDKCMQPDKVREIAARRRKTVAISADTGEGLEQLMDVIEDELSKQLTDIHCLVPYSKGELLNELHRHGTVQHQDFSANGTLVAASVPVSLANKLQHLAVDATHFKQKTTEFFTKR